MRNFHGKWNFIIVFTKVLLNTFLGQGKSEHALFFLPPAGAHVKVREAVHLPLLCHRNIYGSTHYRIGTIFFFAFGIFFFRLRLEQHVLEKTIDSHINKKCPFLWPPKVYCRIHKNQQLHLVMNHRSNICALTSHFFKAKFNIISHLRLDIYSGISRSCFPSYILYQQQ